MDAVHAGAGVGIAGVGNDGAQVALAQMGLGHAHRRGFHPVGGEGSGGTARMFGINQRQIEAIGGRILDAATHGTAEKSEGCANTPFDTCKRKIHDEGKGKA